MAAILGVLRRFTIDKLQLLQIKDDARVMKDIDIPTRERVQAIVNRWSKLVPALSAIAIGTDQQTFLLSCAALYQAFSTQVSQPVFQMSNDLKVLSQNLNTPIIDDASANLVITNGLVNAAPNVVASAMRLQADIASLQTYFALNMYAPVDPSEVNAIKVIEKIYENRDVVYKDLNLNRTLSGFDDSVNFASGDDLFERGVVDYATTAGPLTAYSPYFLTSGAAPALDATYTTRVVTANATIFHTNENAIGTADIFQLPANAPDMVLLVDIGWVNQGIAHHNTAGAVTQVAAVFNPASNIANVNHAAFMTNNQFELNGGGITSVFDEFIPLSTEIWSNNTQRRYAFYIPTSNIPRVLRLNTTAATAVQAIAPLLAKAVGAYIFAPNNSGMYLSKSTGVPFNATTQWKDMIGDVKAGDFVTTSLNSKTKDFLQLLAAYESYAAGRGQRTYAAMLQDWYNIATNRIVGDDPNVVISSAKITSMSWWAIGEGGITPTTQRKMYRVFFGHLLTFLDYAMNDTGFVGQLGAEFGLYRLV